MKYSFARNLISDGEIWINMMLSRNSLSHLYDEEDSIEIYNDIKNEYIKKLNKLVELLKNK